MRVLGFRGLRILGFGVLAFKVLGLLKETAPQEKQILREKTCHANLDRRQQSQRLKLCLVKEEVTWEMNENDRVSLLSWEFGRLWASKVKSVAEKWSTTLHFTL